MSDGKIYALLGLGVAFLLTGLGYGLRVERLRRRGVRTVGQVVGLRPAREPGPHPRLHPVVAFATRDGRPRQAVGPTGTQPAAHRVGDRVTLMYDPRDPTRISLGRGVAARLPAVLAILGGTALITLACALLTHP